MKCEIDGKEVDCKVVENLGYQGGRVGKVVLHDGKEVVVTKFGGIWAKSKPRSLTNVPYYCKGCINESVWNKKQCPSHLSCFPRRSNRPPCYQ